MTTVDAHHHFWRVDAQEQSWRTAAHGAIDRDYLPADLAPDLARSGVDATVLMQSVDEPAENDRLAAFAEQSPAVVGVVGWLPLHDAARSRAELERAWSPSWSGVRCLVARDPMQWLAEPATVELFRDLADRGLAWDVVPVTPEQVSAVLALARAVPELRIVVDHLARPPVDSGGWQPWAGQLAELADCPGTALKVSVGIDVLTAWDAWRTDALQPYVDWALGQFGPERLMLGSNWPVVLLRATYAEAWGGLSSLVRGHGTSGGDLQAILGGIAVQWYGLRVPAASAGDAGHPA